MRKAVMVEGAAKPGGHYSHAVIANGLSLWRARGRWIPRPA